MKMLIYSDLTSYNILLVSYSPGRVAGIIEGLSAPNAYDWVVDLDHPTRRTAFRNYFPGFLLIVDFANNSFVCTPYDGVHTLIRIRKYRLREDI